MSKFQVPHPPESQIMELLSFPHFWCTRVPPIQRLSIKLIPTSEFSKDGIPLSVLAQNCVNIF